MPTLISVNQLPSARFDGLTGFVLAGGASRRMGCPKESLRIDGESMLERQIRVLRSVARRVVVVGGPAGYLDEFDVPIVSDAVAGRGPLGGIYTALVESRTDFNLILGCDLPFVSRNLLTCLVLRAMAEGSEVTVPVSREGRLQPLCAVFRRRALYAVRTRLGLGENKPRGFFTRVHCTTIPWRDLSDAGFRAPLFDNMNTPEEYEYARKRVEGPVAGTDWRKRLRSGRFADKLGKAPRVEGAQK
jgi:molybdopterin-guanine dinucleotide biosynthesis protein A